MINSTNTMKPKYVFNADTSEAVQRKLKIKQNNKDNAQKLLDKYGYFGGKRLLGVNENGTEVWISFKATDKTIEVNCTHDMWSVMPENGGQYAAQRASYFLTKPISRETTFAYYNGERGNVRRHGLVNKNTLLHLEKIIDECDRFTRNNEKPHRDIYRLLAWNIYNSTHDDSYTYPATNWDFCADIQGYTSPEGYYFTGQI